MSSSSTPEAQGDDAARVALDEVEEVEAILEQRPPRTEEALGEGGGGGRGSGWVTAALAAPGLLWIGFDREKRGLHDWLTHTYAVLVE